MKDAHEIDRQIEVAAGQPTARKAGHAEQHDHWPIERRGLRRPLVDVPSAGAALLRLFNELAYGLIVLDSERQVVHINRAARGALAREQSLRVRGRALQAWRECDAPVFSRALDNAFSGKRAAMKIGKPQSTIMLVPLPGMVSTSATGALQVGHIALVFERSACAESLSIAFYAQNHGLTSGEERVLRALNEDQSVGEVARAPWAPRYRPFARM